MRRFRDGMTLKNHFSAYTNEEGVLKRIPPYIQYYTPKEWYEALIDIHEITEHDIWYQDGVYAIAFYQYKFRKIKKYYENMCIRLHRKRICLYFAKDPEIKIYEGEKLAEFKKDLEEKVYETFDYQTRTTSFRNLYVSGRCFNCSLILSESNRNSYRYCSEECKEAFYLNYRFDYSRDWVWQRDWGICQICKKSTRYIVESKHKLWFVNVNTNKIECDIVHISLFDDDSVIKYQRKRAVDGVVYYLPYFIRIREYDRYEIDHIVEVASGKTKAEQVRLFVDYTNLQTVCIPCHKKKTGDFLRKRFTKKRSKSKKVEEFI